MLKMMRMTMMMLKTIWFKVTLKLTCDEVENIDNDHGSKTDR